MPRPYRPEFRTRAMELVGEGPQIKRAAADLGNHEVRLHSQLRQDEIDSGRGPGRSMRKDTEPREAGDRIRQLAQELEIVKRASGLGPRYAALGR